MVKKRKYKNPPINEAVCEFRFTDQTEWDQTVPGRFYEKVESFYPLKDERTIHEIKIIHEKKGSRHEIQRSRRVVFLSADKKDRVEIGDRILCINRLRPYVTWEQFRPKIQNSLNTLEQIVSIRGFERIGLRYVNRINVPGSKPELDDYFSFQPFLGKDLPSEFVDFIVGCQFQFEEGRDLCKVTMTNTHVGSPEISSFLLDIDYVLIQPKAINVHQYQEWIRNAHDKVEEIFEGCIKDELRKIFKEIS